MATPKTRKPVFSQHINAWRMHRQFLSRSYPTQDLTSLIDSIGWIYSPGCSTPYLTLWARLPSFRVDDLNRLVFDECRFVQMETLRGCTMLVPREQAAVALRIRPRTFTELSKQARQQMPVSEPEMGRLKSAIAKALQNGPKTTRQLQHEVPSALIRDFPSQLKRIGLTNSLSLSINLLKEEGKVVKIQSQGRLDSTEYSYELTANILADVDPFELRTEEAYTRLAAEYFRVEEPARIKDFAWWAGINVTDAIRAANELQPKLVPIAVDGIKDEFLVAESSLDEFFSFVPPKVPVINLIPYRDIFLKGQREIVDRFVRTIHADKPFSRWKGKLINDPLATVICNGQVVGVWQWNRDEEEVDFLLFEAVSKPIEKKIQKRASELGEFIRNNLGSIRLQGLDYGPHQMTCIHDLSAHWGKGAHVHVHA